MFFCGIAEPAVPVCTAIKRVKATKCFTLFDAWTYVNSGKAVPRACLYCLANRETSKSRFYIYTPPKKKTAFNQVTDWASENGHFIA